MKTLLLHILALGFILITTGLPANATTLKSNSAVEGDKLMLSDVFDDLPKGKERVLGASPEPGQQMVLNARTLLRIATALNLDWRPSYSGETITIKRAATIIPKSDVESAIKTSIEKHGITGDYDLTFTNSFTNIILPVSVPQTLAVKSIDIINDDKNFKAIVVAPSLEDPRQEITVLGTIQHMISIPVTADTFRQGMVLRDRDLITARIPLNDVKRDTALNTQDLIGMTPRRVIFPGKPISISDLEAPQIIARGDMVTMIFEDNGIRLTAKGKALENGAKGDFVRVANLATSRTVEAQVNAEREVIVSNF